MGWGRTRPRVVARRTITIGALAVVAMVLLATPSWAWHPILSGGTGCSNGDHIVTWSIGNSQADSPMTIAAASASVGNVDYGVDGYSAVVPGGGSTSATTTVPGGVTGMVMLVVTGTWPNGERATRWTQVGLESDCPTTTTTTTTTSTTTTSTTTTSTTTTSTTSTTIEPTTTTTEQTTTTNAPTTSTTETASTTVEPTSVSSSSTTEPTTSSTVHESGSTVPSPSSTTTVPLPNTLPKTGGSNGLLTILGLGAILVGLALFMFRSPRLSGATRRRQ